MKDLGSLVDALVSMGFNKKNIEIHELTPTTIRDYHKAVKNANVAIRQQYTGIPSDIGWEKEKDGTFTAHVDDFKYYGSEVRYDAAWSTKLQCKYNVEAAKKTFKANGWDFKESIDKDNNPVILATEKVVW
jgi:hypothetical protein